MTAARHDERCVDCKNRFHALLQKRFGVAERNSDLNLSSRIEDWRGTDKGPVLERIYSALQSYRGFNSFVRTKKLARADFYVPRLSLILEFDESQHFTRPRELSLGFYPSDGSHGFSLDRWQELCRQLNKRDNDPPYRDEQRAWYDTLKDFASSLSGKGSTIRVYSRDFVWCSLNPESRSDLATFDRQINGEAL
jgi:hypothetical protein